MKVPQMLQPQWLSYIYFIVIVVAGVAVDYASAQQLPQPQLQQEQQPQKQLEHTEVNYTESESARFGAEIVVHPVATLNNNNNNNNNNTHSNATRQQQQKYMFVDKVQENEDKQKEKEEDNEEKEQQQQQQQQKVHQHISAVIQAIDSSNIPPSPRVARRLDAPNDPPTQLIVAQPDDAPLAKKNRANNKSAINAPSTNAATPTAMPTKQRQSDINSRASSRNSRKSAVAITTTTTKTTSQRSNSFDSQAQSAPQSSTITTTRTRNSNKANVTRPQMRRGDEQRGKTLAQPSSTPAVGTGNNNRRNVNKSRQDVSATNKVVGAIVKSKPKSKVTSTSTSTPTTSTTVRPPEIFNFIPSNPFSFFSPTLWALSSPPKPASTNKPPKKYTPTPIAITTSPAKERKSSNRKTKVTTTTTPKTTTTTTTTKLPKTRTKPIQTSTTTQAPKKNTTDGPFRIALPTFNFFGVQAPTSNEPDTEKDKRNTVQNLRNQYDCPRESEVRFQLFPKICKTDADCTVWNRNELCCEIFGAKSCVTGVNKPLEETSHSPILGLIPRKCPTRPLAELWWQVQECKTDTDCWPRVCCPDGNKRYCRTSQPELETVPVPVKRSFNYLSEYLECTPPPPPIFDLHPKTCASTLDCFPNVCCQESGLRHCRPPKKSLLTWMANILNVDFVKRLAQNIVIK